MRRLLGYLPVGLIGIPVVMCLLAGADRSAGDKEVAPAPVVSEGSLPDAAGLERLAQEDPVAFLEACLRRYRQDVRGYHCTMQKRERVDGRMQPREVIDAYYREEPYSVSMQWLEGAGRADRVLFVEGENDGKLLARPSSGLVRGLLGKTVTRDPGTDDFQKLSRFGFRKGTERLLGLWKPARDRGTLRVEYGGEVRVKETGDRLCYQLTWYPEEPQEKNVTRVTVYIDTETWLQTGTVLADDQGQLVGEYFFRDIELNPEFAPTQFQTADWPS